MRSFSYGAAAAALLFALPLANTAFAANVGRHQISPPMYNGDSTPPPSSYATDGQLDSLKVALADIDALIARDRASGKLTPVQARVLESRDASLARQAMQDSRSGGGMIPDGQYHGLRVQADALRAQA